MTEPMRARVLGPNDGRAGMLGSMGVRFMLAGEETGGGFSLVEHPIPPRALAAPLHRHANEDEYSFVLEGRMGALLKDMPVKIILNDDCGLVGAARYTLVQKAFRPPSRTPA